jgi:hypothetical protein
MTEINTNYTKEQVSVDLTKMTPKELMNWTNSVSCSKIKETHADRFEPGKKKYAQAFELLASMKDSYDRLHPEPKKPSIPRTLKAPAPAIDLNNLTPEGVENSKEPTKRYVSKTDPDSKYHLRDRSVAQKPVAIVRELCGANPKADRKTIIALCEARGVNKNTAATQYSLYKAGIKTAQQATAKAAAEAAGVEEGGEE